MFGTSSPDARHCSSWRADAEIRAVEQAATSPAQRLIVALSAVRDARWAAIRDLTWNVQRHGVSIERIRRDRVLHEALTARADPLYLALVFGLSHTTASKYALIACDLLAGQATDADQEQRDASLPL
jgi:hypothetical protein